MSEDSKVTSQQPYFLRALYEWCVDNGFTPHVNVRVDTQCRVPLAYVKDGQIVLNIGPSAVRGLSMDNDFLTFSARFGGVAQEVSVPIENIVSIYARETGEGMAFAHLPTADVSGSKGASQQATGPEPEPTGPGPGRSKGRPSLRVVK
jgi:stringent starvation protein B